MVILDNILLQKYQINILKQKLKSKKKKTLILECSKHYLHLSVCVGYRLLLPRNGNVLRNHPIPTRKAGTVWISVSVSILVQLQYIPHPQWSNDIAPRVKYLTAWSTPYSVLTNESTDSGIPHGVFTQDVRNFFFSFSFGKKGYRAGTRIWLDPPASFSTPTLS